MVRRLAPDMCPILVVAANAATRNMLTDCLEVWDADVCAAADRREAEALVWWCTLTR